MGATAAAAELTAEAVVTKEEPPFSDEMESESPTQPLDQLNEALIVEGQVKDTERYIVKATPMTTSSSSSHNANVMPPAISQTLEENKKDETEKKPLESDTDPKAEEVLGGKERTDSPQAELPQAEEKAADFNVTAGSTTTEKETTETTEPSDIVEEVVVVVTPAATMNKTVEEPEIPSFSEYTKKALEEEDR